MSDERAARLFVAIDLSEEARDIIAREQERIRARVPAALRFVPAPQLHLTLAFMAAVDRPHVPAIEACIGAQFDVRPFRVRFAGLGVLPPRGRPRVLYMTCAEGADEVMALQRVVADRLEQVGVRRERRPFRPHLTIARWREGGVTDRRLVSSHGVDAMAEQRVTAVTLYDSRLSRTGAVHRALVRGKLLAG